MDYLVVFLGGGLGATVRYGFSIFGVKLFASTAPIGTLTVNILGSLLIGLVAAYLEVKGHFPQHIRLFAMTGFLGGFTTFSAFSLEVILMVERAEYFSASLYAILTIALSVLAAFIGLAAVRLVFT
jgi:fluoride exporter